MSTHGNTCQRCVVRGHVQGVFFRASAADQAGRLGLTGHARNRDDGSVEVLICGPEAARDEMISWLWKGPAAAQVEDVRCELREADPAPAHFSTG
ncbi:acylphosphatase [Thiohalospira halophila DSM 15071]|uniref:acylphosphatase n=1 Tax=Thiohalospira halophila DSM 15071 TaxID=1123397 RepID=A0A1I1QLY1_9GAMM|nr:acylphosphatase [Thiohalospira halophila]SFD19080.1 acylphosphatase [Thiohalospira halophila DSM 15071]